MKRKRESISKLLIISNFGFKTIEIKINTKIRIILLTTLCLIVSIFSLSIYKYNFYKTKVSTLLSDNTIAASSINQMSSDEIKLIKDIVKLKSDIQAIDNFLRDVSSIDEEVKRNLKIKYSSVTFADIFTKNAKSYDRVHPASGELSSTDKEVNDKLIKDSIEREKSYKKLMSITPSGYPVDGNVIISQKHLNGPGVLISVPYGTPIRATANGKISKICESKKDSYIIEIEHPSENNNHTILTRYLFCSKPLVFEGKEVNKGQIIAYSGFYPGSFDNITGYQIIIDNTLVQP
ncbi:MAG TPA: M23 family metallopeptidase [Caldisericia bacterium]|nr:M23 family metallopeptidase [Caldisericia bacterium]